jgi:hypothetical protein
MHCNTNTNEPKLKPKLILATMVQITMPQGTAIG